MSDLEQHRQRNGRLRAEVFTGLTREMVLQAIEELDPNYPPEGLSDSKAYDLIHEGRPYPPKAVFAIAAGYLLGAKLRGRDFSGGASSPCFRILKECGFEIVAKKIRPARCWALLANPSTYDALGAVKAASRFDTWGVAKSDVRAGDRVLLWQAQGSSGNRGIVGAAEVITDPVYLAPHASPFWTAAQQLDTNPARRVHVRYLKCKHAPLWLDDHEKVIGGLSVRRATGGSVFRISADEWAQVTTALGVSWERAAHLQCVLDDDGTRIDATFELDYDGDDVGLTFMSRGGSIGSPDARNTEYDGGLRVLIERLARLDATLIDAYLDSQTAQPHQLRDRSLGLPGMPHLISIGQGEKLANALQAAAEATLRAPEAQGGENRTRRIKLILGLPSNACASLASLASELSGCVEYAVAYNATTNPEDLEEAVVSLLAQGKLSNTAGNRTPRRRTSSTGTAYERLASVKSDVLLLADNCCDLCGAEGPFEKEDGNLYLEVHHVKMLADGGPDTVDNAVAVCPNCHRALHYSKNRDELVSRLYERVERLAR